MKTKLVLFLCIGMGWIMPSNAQSCRDLWLDAQKQFEAGHIVKAKKKYQQVINCGELYVADSKKQIELINRILREADKNKPFAISDDTIEIPYQGGQDVITVDGDGAWKAIVEDSGKNWCSIRREKGKVVIISDANENNTERTCEISISMGGKSKKVRVKNDGAPEMLVPSVENVTFPSKGETNIIGIRANTEWEITDAPGWVITSKENGKVTLTAQANGDNKDRKAEIKIESTSKAIIINIYQGAGLDHLAFSKNDLHFGPEGGDEYINIYTDADNWHLGDFPHWCQVTKVADNLLRVHCTPNDPINLSREASVNVTTGMQTLGINVSQEAKPFVAIIPDFGIGGRAVSFGISAGYVSPIISTSSSSDFTGSVVNYALGNASENASYSVSGGFNVSTFADIRVFKNFYVKAGLEFTHYTYKNEFNEDVYRRIAQAAQYYLGGTTKNSYKEEYTINQLEIPILASYRLATSPISHVQLNVGPVIYYGLSAKMKLSGNTSAENTLRAYRIIDQKYTNQYYDLYHSSIKYAGSGELDLYDKHIAYEEIHTIGLNAPISKSFDLDDSPLNRLNFGMRVGAAFEYAGVSLGIEYNLMLTNAANKKFWESDRLTIFDQTPGLVMSGYKQHNSYLGVKLAYTFRY